ncbi:MAG: hypothetical protein ACKVHQ_15175 [Gammaproteobacteria bacterium]
MSNNFVICIENNGYDASLEKRKLYKALSDKDAESKGLLRIKDESGDDYLYPKEFFISADLPLSAEKAIIEIM